MIEEKFNTVFKKIAQEFNDEKKIKLISAYLKIKTDKLNLLSDAAKDIYNVIYNNPDYEIEEDDKNPFNTIDFVSRFDAAIEVNSNAGWPLTENIDIINYIKISKNSINEESRSRKFVEAFEENNCQHYHLERDYILANIEEKNMDLFQQVCSAFEEGKYLITIPSLILIIEGTLANILTATQIGNSLLTIFENQIDRSKSDVETLIAISLSKYLRTLFKNHSFINTREENLNRNWVLHGRDDPRLWGKRDFYSLICILSSLETTKQLL